MLLCFLQRAQQLSPQAPDDYTSDTAFALRSGAFSLTDAVDAIADGLVPDAHADEAQLPSMVVVMNETFSDLSRYAAIDGAYGGPVHLRKAEEEALVHGDAYVSALGGGTCNSEFEFLTGCSTGLLGAGVYPYMPYSLENVDNLAAYLGNLGYGTTAIHPAAASNWRRDRVYEQLGFDRFIDISGFEGAQTRRGMVTDAETYGRVLQVLSEEDGPQFVFDVTIASHGGYTTGELADEDMVPALVEGSPDAEVGEYLGCIQHSDREFAEFLDALEGLDRPVVVCMFHPGGDARHQPQRLSGCAELVALARRGKRCLRGVPSAGYRPVRQPLQQRVPGRVGRRLTAAGAVRPDGLPRQGADRHPFPLLVAPHAKRRPGCPSRLFAWGLPSEHARTVCKR